MIYAVLSVATAAALDHSLVGDATPIRRDALASVTLPSDALRVDDLAPAVRRHLAADELLSTNVTYSSCDEICGSNATCGDICASSADCGGLCDPDDSCGDICHPDPVCGDICDPFPPPSPPPADEHHDDDDDHHEEHRAEDAPKGKSDLLPLTSILAMAVGIPIGLLVLLSCWYGYIVLTAKAPPGGPKKLKTVEITASSKATDPSAIALEDAPGVKYGEA